MKQVIASALLLLSPTLFAFDRDGCYQMYTLEEMHPIVCVRGADEQRRGVTVALIDYGEAFPVSWCERAIESGGNDESWSATFDESSGVQELLMAGRKSGRIVLRESGKEPLVVLYKKVSSETASRIGNVFASERCLTSGTLPVPRTRNSGRP